MRLPELLLSLERNLATFYRGKQAVPVRPLKPQIAFCAEKKAVVWVLWVDVRRQLSELFKLDAIEECKTGFLAESASGESVERKACHLGGDPAA